MFKKKILIIDDDPNITELTKVLLESHNYKVLTVCDGVSGLQEAKKHKPRLIILDIMMPNVDGISICKSLKSDKKTKNIPVIILTVKWLDEDQKRALNAGASCYITKPFETNELLKKIREILKA